MTNRPYFNYGIEQLYPLFNGANKDPHLLNCLSHELEHRKSPKAKELLGKIQKELESLGAVPGRSAVGATPVHPSASNRQIPDRVGVECAHCETNNFVSTLDDVVQYLSCSNCKTSYEAVFKYGVMRTKFEEAKTKSTQPSPLGWILLAVVVLFALVVIVK